MKPDYYQMIVQGNAKQVVETLSPLKRKTQKTKALLALAYADQRKVKESGQWTLATYDRELDEETWTWVQEARLLQMINSIPRRRRRIEALADEILEIAPSAFYARFMKDQYLFIDGEWEEGIEALEKLRKEFPGAKGIDRNATRLFILTGNGRMAKPYIMRIDDWGARLAYLFTASHVGRNFGILAVFFGIFFGLLSPSVSILTAFVLIAVFLALEIRYQRKGWVFVRQIYLGVVLAVTLAFFIAF